MDPAVSRSSLSLQDRLREAAPRLGPFAGRVRHYPRVGSTNDVAADLAADDAPHGTVVVADEQTAGRGRHGNRWFSPPGSGLYVSVLLRADAPPVLTLAAGVAAAEALAQTAGLDAVLEWPNDVVVETAGGRRKVAGILVEASTVGDRVDRVVVGMGVNPRDGAWPPEVASHTASGLVHVPCRGRCFHPHGTPRRAPAGGESPGFGPCRRGAAGRWSPAPRTKSWLDFCSLSGVIPGRRPRRPGVAGGPPRAAPAALRARLGYR